MRKLGLVIIAVFIGFNTFLVGYSQAFVYTHAIKQLAVKSATWVAGAGIRVPALATMTSAGASGAIKWIPLMIPQARVAKIGAYVIGFAGSALVGYGADKLINWMQDNGYDYSQQVPSDVFQPDTYYGPSNEVFTPSGYSISQLQDPAIFQSLSTDTSAGVNPIGCYADGTAVYNAVEAYRTALGVGSYGYFANTFLGWHSYKLQCHYNIGGNEVYRYISFMYPVSESYTLVEIVPPPEYTPADLSAIETALATDLAAEDAVAIAASIQALEIAAQGLTSSTSIAHSNAAGWETIQGEIDASITEAQKNAIEADATDADEWAAAAGATTAVAVPGTLDVADVQNAVIAALVARGLSNTQIQTAMDNALATHADYLEGAIPDAIAVALDAAGLTADAVDAVELTPLVGPTAPGDDPDKNLIEDVIDGFMASLATLPIVEMITDLEIQASGSSSISIAIPGFVGGESQNATIDFSQWATQFQFMGSILLMITGIRWTIYLFE